MRVSRLKQPVQLVVAAASLVLIACSSPGDTTNSLASQKPSANISKTDSSTSAKPTAVASSVKPTNSPSSSVDRLAKYYDQKLSWRRCDSDMQCATLMVPVSYEQPTAYGDTYINIAKLTAWGKRRGAIVLNPGGPGGSGIEYASAGQAVVSSRVLRNYDLVGFDPRGVVSSDPIDCISDAQMDAFLAFDASPNTAAEATTAMSLAAQLGKGCIKNAPALARFVDTESVARDMDVLRAALGEKKLNYLGKSYGTFIGSTYARLFPSQVGRMVLDGVVDPALNNTQLSKMQAMGFERAFSRFLDYCISRGCPLGNTRSSALAKLKDVITSSDSSPLPTGESKRPLTQSLLVSGILFGMYDSTYGWSQTLESLRSLVAGDGSDTLASVDWFLGRENGRYKDNSNEIIYAVNCIDREDRPGLTEIRQLAALWKKQYPLFGEYLAWSMSGCANWPAPARGKAAPWKGDPIPPVLIVGNTWDPATPIEGARALAKQMPRSVFMEWKGDGHTAYMQGSGCVDDRVNAFFNDGKLPPSGTVCE